MGEHLGAAALQTLFGHYFIFKAQSKWPDLINLMDSLPPQAQAMPDVWRGYQEAYTSAGDFEKALEYTLKVRPTIQDRELWAQEFTDKERRDDCLAAGVLVEAGDSDLGEDLVRFLIANHETSEPGDQTGTERGNQMLDCYLVGGDFEKVLDFVDRETAQGRLLD